MYQKVGIGDFVWEDLDADGIQDVGENGIPGVTVHLLDASFAIIDTYTTMADGYYEFNNLDPGDYYVEFILPSGYVFSPANQGIDDTKDSDANPSTGRTSLIHLVSGDGFVDKWDCGMYSPETRKIFVPPPYYDEEGNEYITDNLIYLNYTGENLNKTYFRIWKWNEGEWILIFNWTTTEEASMHDPPFYPINLCEIGLYFNLSCCGLYQIEYYSTDIYGNKENVKWNDVCVDCKPPTSVKEYGTPNIIGWAGPEPIHWITSDTLIFINATDGPCGSGVKEIWYQLLYPNGTFYPGPSKDDWALYDGPFTVNGPDGIYIIYYYAIDNVGHVEAVNKQKFILDNIPPLGNRTMIWIDPAYQVVNENEMFTITIKVAPYVSIKALQCSLKFDPLLITIDSVKSGDMFPNFIEGDIDNVNGTITGMAGYCIGDGVEEEKIFAIINGTVGAVNISTKLHLYDVVALDIDNKEVPIYCLDGEIKIEILECPYDINDDGIVNETDISLIVEHWNEIGYPGWIKEDVSGVEGIPDGRIDIFDLIALVKHWGECP